MNTPLRLLAYGTALVAVFALSLVTAQTLRPAAAESPTKAGQTTSHPDEEVEMDHSAAPTSHPTESHGGGHSSAPNAVSVRGLAAAQDGFQMEELSAPARIGEDGPLSFRLTGPDGGPVTDYVTAHDKDLHLIVVRGDGTRFRHVHPATDGAGTWSVPWRWIDAGTLSPVPLGADSRTARVDGFTVTLDGSLSGGQESTLAFTVARDGEPVTTLQPYLGAAGHLVALRAGDLAYLHVHPTQTEPTSASGPDIVFATQPPTPGRYLLYLDFQVEGQVHTAAFTVTASR